MARDRHANRKILAHRSSHEHVRIEERREGHTPASFFSYVSRPLLCGSLRDNPVYRAERSDDYHC
jgi:hypothetical protein